MNLIASAFKLGSNLTAFSDEFPDGLPFKGFIFSSDELSPNTAALPTPPGLADKRRFLLFAPPDTISESVATVVHDDRVYELLCAEPMFLGNTITHWEAILRLSRPEKGGAHLD